MTWLLANWLALLAAIFAFGFVVFVHESGHFFIARYVGVRVHEFSLGFGPHLYRRQSGDTEYSIRAVPLGGFVRLEGEDSSDNKPDDPGNFQNKSTWQKMAVICGGCLMNYLSAFLVYTFVGMVHGLPQTEPIVSTTVASVLDGTPAAAAGVQSGDKIIAIDGKPVPTWADVMKRIGEHGGVPMKLTVTRDGKDVTLDVTPSTETDTDDKGVTTTHGRIGVMADQSGQVDFVPAEGGATQVMSEYWSMAGRLTSIPFVLVYNLYKHKETLKEVKQQAGGPVMIGHLLLEAAGKGVWHLLFFWTVISTLVGGFNLLPIPALDGMRGFIVLIGAIRRRPINQDKEAIVHTVGLAFLLTLVLILTIQDIQKLHSGFHMLQ